MARPPGSESITATDGDIPRKPPLFPLGDINRRSSRSRSFLAGYVLVYQSVKTNYIGFMQNLEQMYGSKD